MSEPRAMHILMTADAVGGVWQYARTLGAELVGAGHRVTLALLGPPLAAEEARQAAGVEIIHTGLPLDWLARDRQELEEAARRLADIARHTKADLLHCNSPALAGAARFGVPVVAAAHGCVATWWRAAKDVPLARKYGWHARMMRAGLLAADATVAPSAAFAQTLQDTYNLPRRPVAVHNGREPVAGDDQAAPVEAALTVGRLWDQAKNGPVLDQAAAALKHPLLAAGALCGPHREAFAPQHLRCLGHLSEEALARLYRSRPVFVTAASFEPFGLAVLEAASAGCALILSDIPTFRELWDGAALFVDAQDATGFANAIDGVIADPARRSALGRAARLRSTRYTPAAMAERMLAIYRSVLAQEAAAA